MDDLAKLRDKLRKITALFDGAATTGERDAAAAALARVRRSLAELQNVEQPIEMRFGPMDTWHRRLFVALCRRYGLKPFRYKGQRMTTLMVRAPESFVNNTLWPEYQQIRQALNQYLNDATERIIREEVFGGDDDPSEVFRKS